jgi:hypothetical protein
VARRVRAERRRGRFMVLRGCGCRAARVKNWDGPSLAKRAARIIGARGCLG